MKRRTKPQWNREGRYDNGYRDCARSGDGRHCWHVKQRRGVRNERQEMEEVCCHCGRKRLAVVQHTREGHGEFCP